MSATKMTPEELREFQRMINNRTGQDLPVEQIKELIETGNIVSLDDPESVSQIPDEVRRAIIGALVGSMDEGEVDSLGYEGMQKSLLGAETEYGEIQNERIDATLKLRKIDWDIRRRKAKVLKALLDDGGLGSNEREREINTEAAILGDEELVRLINSREAASVMVDLMEMGLDVLRHHINTMIQSLHAELRHAELRQSAERASELAEARTVAERILADVTHHRDSEV